MIALWASTNAEDFVDAKEEACANLKIRGFSGRFADGRYCFGHRRAHRNPKHGANAQVAGSDWNPHGGLLIVWGAIDDRPFFVAHKPNDRFRAAPPLQRILRKFA